MATPTPWDATFSPAPSGGATIAAFAYDPPRHAVWYVGSNGVVLKYDSRTAGLLLSDSVSNPYGELISPGWVAVSPLDGAVYVLRSVSGSWANFISRHAPNTWQELGTRDLATDFAGTLEVFASGVYVTYGDVDGTLRLRQFSHDLASQTWNVALGPLAAFLPGHHVEDGAGRHWVVDFQRLYRVEPNQQVTAFDYDAGPWLTSEHRIDHLGYDPEGDRLVAMAFGAGPALNRLATIDPDSGAVLAWLEHPQDLFTYRSSMKPRLFGQRLIGYLRNPADGNAYSLVAIIDLASLSVIATYSLLPEETWSLGEVPTEGLWCSGVFLEVCEPAVWGWERLLGPEHTDSGVWRLDLPDMSPDPSCEPLEAPAVCGPVPLKDIMAELYQQAGLVPHDYDVSQQTQLVTGYVVPRRMSAREALLPLLHAYFVDVTEADDQLIGVNRGQPSTLTIPEADLGAHEGGQEPPPPLEVARTPDYEIPRRVEVQYIEPARDYQTSVQQAQRHLAPEPTMGSGQPHTLSLPLVMGPDQAKQIAERTLYTAWVERTQLRFSLGPTYQRLAPADVLTVQADGVSYRLRLLQLDQGASGVLQCQGVVEDATTYHSEATGAVTSIPAKELYPPAYGLAVFLDTAIWLEAHDDPGFYVGVIALEPGWRFSAVFKSADDLVYTPIAQLSQQLTWGLTGPPIGAHPHEYWDRTHTLLVQLYHGALYSAPEAAVLNGANVALYGDEVIQWQVATELAPNIYELSVLLRGRKGTEVYSGSHQAGELFLVPSIASVVRYPAPLVDMFQPRLYTTVSPGQLLDQVGSQSFTNQVRGQRCYAPVHLRGTRDEAGNLTISWVRRTRYPAEWLDGLEAPLGEASEVYEVVILGEGGAELRTFATPFPSVVYSAAEQTADFGSPQAVVPVAIYQHNSLIGRGYPGLAAV